MAGPTLRDYEGIGNRNPFFTRDGLPRDYCHQGLYEQDDQQLRYSD